MRLSKPAFLVLTSVIILLVTSLMAGASPASQDEVPDSTFDPGDQTDRTREIIKSPARSMTDMVGEADILLIQTSDPWESAGHFLGSNWYDGITSDTLVLDALGYTYDIADWADISTGSVNIFSYPVILIVNDQVQDFYDAYATSASDFESFVFGGGILVFFAAGGGWAGGQLNAELPGGVSWTMDLANRNVIVDGDHPIVSAVLSDGISLTNDDLHSNFCSHGYFSNLPKNANIIMREDAAAGSEPTLIEYPIGSGKVIASTLTWEHSWSYHTGTDQYGIFARKALDDVFLYAFSSGVAITEDVRMKLYIEDAPPGVIVNKVAGDNDGPTDETFVDIVAEITSYDSTIIKDISVTLTVPGNALGIPVETSVRTWHNDDTRQSVSYTPVTTGQYRIKGDLAPSPFGTIHVKQFIWRFKVPDSPGELRLSAEIEVPDYSVSDPLATATLNIIAYADSIILANRTLLYDNYTDSQVNDLLQQMYTIAQGPPRNQSPTPVVYYVDRYHTDIRDWDQGAIDYTSEATANTVANLVDGLVEDWLEDSTVVFEITILGTKFKLPILLVDYLMIVGDDDTIPYYRYDDPDGYPESRWTTNSATNPAIHATDENVFFTDNVYADDGGGTDWQTGSLEVAIGRIIGDSAADMRTFLTNGANPYNHDEGGSVMASVEGWELGLEPHVGTGVADAHDVPLLLRNRDFAVRNDGIPATEVRTIDILTATGTNAAWITQFENAANNTAGMDIFFIGGHNSYDAAFLQLDTIYGPADTPGNFTRFATDNPIALIVGCHGGLSVPNVDNHGGVNDNMVRDLAHEGASGYIGATGFSYGSPGSLHGATWGENLLQIYFAELLSRSGPRSQTMGEAMRQAKIDYTGTGNRDRKTLTEYVVYGIPWQTIAYPTPLAMSELSDEGMIADSIDVQTGLIIKNQQVKSEYSQTVNVNIGEYEVTQQGEFDIINVEGGTLVYEDGYPVLPIIKAYEIPLPQQAEVTDVKILSSNPKNIGEFNIPAAFVKPFSQGGIQFTADTDIKTLYPAKQVTYEVDPDKVTLLVYPVQHNPTTDKTVFSDRFQIQITYDAPLVIMIDEFQTESMHYKPGQPVNWMAKVSNIGDKQAVLTPSIHMRDQYGETVSMQSYPVFSVASGDTYTLSQVWDQAPPGGAYEMLLVLTKTDSAVALATSSLNVLSAEIRDFVVPDTVTPSEYKDVQMTVANYQGSQIGATAEVLIINEHGVEVGRLLEQNFVIPFNSQQTATWSWNPESLEVGPYTLHPQATAGGLALSYAAQETWVTHYAPDFSASPAAGPAPLRAMFTNLSQGDFTKETWDFGDGSSSSSSNPSHTYTKPGRYTVKLTVGGPDGEESVIKNDIVLVEETLEANFSAMPRNGSVPLKVTFTDKTSGEFALCDWDFGDGATSKTCGEVVHVYTDPGEFTVKLSVTGSTQQDTEYKDNYVTVTSESIGIYLPIVRNP